MDGSDLDAPCKWCGYNGPSYWQSGSHSKECPWHKVGGSSDRDACEDGQIFTRGDVRQDEHMRPDMILDIPDDRAVLMDVGRALYEAAVRARGMAARAKMGLEQHPDTTEAEMTRRAQALESLCDAIREAECG